MLAESAAVPMVGRELASSALIITNLTSATTGQPAYFWDGGYPGNPINPPFINPSYGIGFISASAPGAAAIGAGPTTAQTMSYGDPFIGGIPPHDEGTSA